jgi:hypothetical protein
MARPDPLSLRIARPISPDDAERVRADLDLQSELLQFGGSLEEIVEKLRLPAYRRVTPEPSTMFLLRELRRRNIRFVVIGGIAARVYGSTHSTSDVDVCHARDARNLRALAHMLRDLKAEFRRQPKFTPPDLHENTLATEMDFVFTTPYGHLDLIGEFTGVGTYEQASAEAIDAEVRRLKLPVLALPKLLDAKRSTGRPKDQLVAAELDVIMKICQALQRPAMC